MPVYHGQPHKFWMENTCTRCFPSNQLCSLMSLDLSGFAFIIYDFIWFLYDFSMISIWFLCCFSRSRTRFWRIQVDVRGCVEKSHGLGMPLWSADHWWIATGWRYSWTFTAFGHWSSIDNPLRTQWFGFYDFHFDNPLIIHEELCRFNSVSNSEFHQKRLRRHCGSTHPPPSGQRPSWLFCGIRQQDGLGKSWAKPSNCRNKEWV